MRKIWESELTRVTLILAGLLTVCFYPCIFGNRTLLLSAQETQSVLPTGADVAGQRKEKLTFSRTLDPGAPAWQTEPHLALNAYQYKVEHVAPLWNPYQGYGRPLAADMTAQPFSPLTLPLIFHLTPRTYSLFLVFRLLLLGIGGFLFVRNFVSFIPAVAGAIATAFGGYYILFITMPHLSVEIFLPWALAAVELVFKRPSYRAFLCFTAVSVLLILGGMPETTALILVFVAVYLTFRLLTDPALRPHWLKWYATFGLGVVASAGLCAFLLLPFFEFMRNSFNAHEAKHYGSVVGLAHDTLNKSIFTYLFPLLFGPPVTSVFPNIFNGLRNYSGLVLLFIALVAISRMLARRPETRSLNLLTLFFSASTLFVVLKRYGFPPVNVLGELPILDLIFFSKYDELIFSVSVAVLCALGLEYVLRGEVSKGLCLKLLVIVFCIIPLTVLISRAVIAKVILVLHIRPHFAMAAIGVPTFLLFLTCLAVLHYDRGGTAPLRRLTSVLTVLMTIELLCNFIVPSYHWFEGLAYIEDNPYKGGPFVDFLKSRTTQQERVFGRDFVLHPSWASPFQLNDIRDLDALYYRKYFPFLHAFLPAPASPFNNDLGDRFRAEGAFDFATPRERRLLQLSSVKYIASTRTFEAPDGFVASILQQNTARIEPGKEAFVRRMDSVVNGLGKAALLEHPPYARLPYRIDVPEGPDEKLKLSYTIDPAMWQGPGDGVNFRLEVQGTSGSIEKVFESYIDPKHNPGERRWMNATVDLTKYQGQKIKLLLSTDGGPNGDTAGDWAEWAGFRFADAPKGAAEELFKPVYAAEVQIFKYDRILPRAALFFGADVVDDEAAALRRISDPALDIFSKVVVNAGRLSPEQRKEVRAIDFGGSEPAKAAEIQSYLSRDVKIETNVDRDAILVLNDTDYPGWEVTVDGKPSRIFPANYLFRGVILKPGHHLVEFTYDPTSWKLGLAISGLTLALLIAGGFAVKRRSPRATYVPPRSVLEDAPLGAV